MTERFLEETPNLTAHTADTALAADICDQVLDALSSLPFRDEAISQLERELVDERLNLLGSAAIARDPDAEAIVVHVQFSATPAPLTHDRGSVAREEPFATDEPIALPRVRLLPNLLLLAPLLLSLAVWAGLLYLVLLLVR
jgi:hypothetical protein